MPFKISFLLIILTLVTILLVAEGRGGRGRGGSLGTTFSRGSNKKHGSPSSTSIHRKVVSSSPVHKSFTKSIISVHSVEQKSARHHSRHRNSGGSHSGNRSHNSRSRSSSPKSSISSSGHRSYSRADAPNTPSHHSSSHYHTQPHPRNSQTHATSWSSHGSSAAHYNALGANSHISHTWGTHQLPLNHIYVTQPSSMPSNVIYFAQPPTYSSRTNDAEDFVNGYLIGQSLSQRNHRSHHHYYNHRHQSPKDASSGSTDAKVDSERNKNTSSALNSNKIYTTNQTYYWPTDFEVSLAPLNNSLLPENVTPINQEAIFRNHYIHIAQTLTINNLTFELPTASTSPPDTLPTNGIICMPWLFNETDPTHPELIGTTEKTICFPIPSPPPTIPQPPLFNTTKTTEVSIDECRECVS